MGAGCGSIGGGSGMSSESGVRRSCATDRRYRRSVGPDDYWMFLPYQPNQPRIINLWHDADLREAARTRRLLLKVSGPAHAPMRPQSKLAPTLTPNIPWSRG